MRHLQVYPSQANFTYARLAPPVEGIRFRNRLLTHHGRLIRECSSKTGSTSQHFRIATRPPADVDRLVAAMNECVAHEASELERGFAKCRAGRT